MIFIALMIFFCITDIRYYKIPNVVVLPAILLGCILTGHWLPALIMLIVGAYLYEKEIFCGGDVKLLMLAGAFMGWLALPAFILSRLFILSYRYLKQNQEMLPYAPFWALGCIIVQLSRLVVTP